MKCFQVMSNVARGAAMQSDRCAGGAWRRAAAVRSGRRGVTLIELLVTMAILAILAAVIYGGANAAMESARTRRTKSLIARINGLLMERWETYETRRVSIEYIGPTPNPRDIPLARLFALRMTMKLEMPDRWSDLLGDETMFNGELVDNQLPGDDVPPPIKEVNFTGVPRFQVPYPPLAKSHMRRYNGLASSDPDIIRANQGAECLYMIVMTATGDGEARTLFGEQDIGDVDGDGAPEFLDGWGRPIEFIRWPTGYIVRSSLMTGDAVADHDPLDVFRSEPPLEMLDVSPSGSVVVPPQYVNAMSQLDAATPRVAGFRLLPLIYSRGPDGDSDLTVLSETTTQLDPYLLTNDPGFGDFYLGFPADGDGDGGEGWLDNITNHDTGG